MDLLMRFRFFVPVLVLCGTLVAPPTAEARNVPGSAAATTEDLSERASDDLASLILEALDGDGPGVGGVTRDAAGNVTVSSMGGSAETAGGFVVGGGFRFQDIDRSGEADGRIVTGALSFGQRLDGGALVFGALLFEDVDVDTPYNLGTITGRGAGFAVGVETSMASGLDLSAMLAVMALDYDVTRSAGTITGSYDADRWFLDLRAANTVAFGAATMDYAFGLRHVRQSDEAYVETGGGPVAAAVYDSTAVFLNTRTYFGTGAAQPYLQGDLRYVAGGNGAVPGAAAGDDDGLIGFVGLGLRGAGSGLFYDAGLGGHFDEDGYSGASARLSVRFTF